MKPGLKQVPQVGQKIKIPYWEYSGFTPYRLELDATIIKVNGDYYTVSVENDNRYKLLELCCNEFSLLQDN